MKLAVWVPVVYAPAAAWLACNTTVPAPVKVTVEPEMVAGPETTEYVTAPVEFDVAVTMNGASP